jgi:hypothetical protein
VIGADLMDAFPNTEPLGKEVIIDGIGCAWSVGSARAGQSQTNSVDSHHRFPQVFDPAAR